MASIDASTPTSPDDLLGGELDGINVIALEQAVAAPYCSLLLADAGARVIKVERSEGDFARKYDSAVKGHSAYFVWLNRGKESIALDITRMIGGTVLRTPQDALEYCNLN